jgi:hypothetical protein
LKVLDLFIVAQIWKDAQEPQDESSPLTEQHADCIRFLAEMTSACVEIFHRTGELLTVNESRDPLKEAEVLQRLAISFKNIGFILIFFHVQVDCESDIFDRKSCHIALRPIK